MAERKLRNGPRRKDVDFYKGQLSSAEFFINSFLPVTLGKMDSIMNLSSSAIEIFDSSFGGK